MSFLEIIGHMGVIGSAVVACLFLLSVYSIGVMIDRFRRFRAARSQSRSFLPVFAQCLKENKLQEAIGTSRSHDRSHLARVVTAGVTELVDDNNGRLDPAARVAAVSRAVDRASAVISAEMKKGLGGLATIGSTAPFVGLFGTVVGIIHAFQGIAATGSGGIAAVSGGIAEALVATAFGLFVAIPAVTAFNYFTGKLESYQVEMANVGAELMDFVIKQSEAHATR